MRQYYIFDGQAKKGPFDLEELKSKILSKETPVWYEGLTAWIMAGNIDELKEYFAIKTTPPPFPRPIQKNIPLREEILNSFSETTQLYPETKRRRILLPILISIIIIAGIILAVLYYQKIISF
jgi:hypothetical protein